MPLGVAMLVSRRVASCVIRLRLERAAKMHSLRIVPRQLNAHDQPALVLLGGDDAEYGERLGTGPYGIIL